MSNTRKKLIPENFINNILDEDGLKTDVRVEASIPKENLIEIAKVVAITGGGLILFYFTMRGISNNIKRVKDLKVKVA